MTTEQDNAFIRLALQFRDCELWKRLDDSNIFAVRLADGTIGYCCVMGNGGTLYSLALYRGSEGINTYLNTIASTAKAPYQLMLDSAFYTQISCDFVNGNDHVLPKDRITEIREFAKANSLKIRRSKGLPAFTKMEQSYYSTDLNNSTDCNDITLALKAAIDVASKVNEVGPAKAGFGIRYISPEGGSVIPLLTPAPDGGFEWTTVTTPPYTGLSYPAPAFNDSEKVRAIKRLKPHRQWAIGAVKSPAQVPWLDGTIQPIAFILVIKDMVHPLLPDVNKPNNFTHIPTTLADMFIQAGIRPETIVAYDNVTRSLLSDLCRKCDIELTTATPGPEFIEVMASLYTNFM